MQHYLYTIQLLWSAGQISSITQIQNRKVFLRWMLIFWSRGGPKDGRKDGPGDGRKDGPRDGHNDGTKDGRQEIFPEV